MAITKRFVLIHDCTRPDYVIDVLEAAGTKEAFDKVEAINKARKGHRSASWVKADSLEDLIEANPYVKIWYLQKKLDELTKPTTEDIVTEEEVKQEPKKDPKLFWSNGKRKQGV
jgi:hypothetical protein